jgi:hypothetical protein
MLNSIRSKIKKAVLNTEDRLAKEDDLFKWATVSKWRADSDLATLMDWSKDQVKTSDQFFAPSATSITQAGTSLTFTSPVVTKFPVNNLAEADYFAARGSKSAVLIIGHWNSNRTTYNRLAKIYGLSGISAVRVSLPYHDSRKPPDMPIATGMMSADLSLTIESIRQAVIDSRVIIGWLKARGYQRIGIVGASLGSLVGTLIAAHEPSVDALVGYLTCADFGELIWQSTATQHIKESLSPDVSMDQLSQAWSCVSPSSYLRRLNRPGFSMHVGYALYDTVCPLHLTHRMLEELRTYKINLYESSYSCGHNTLGIAPFMQISGFKGLMFMRQALKK